MPGLASLGKMNGLVGHELYISIVSLRDELFVARFARGLSRLADARR